MQCNAKLHHKLHQNQFRLNSHSELPSLISNDPYSLIRLELKLGPFMNEPKSAKHSCGNPFKVGLTSRCRSLASPSRLPRRRSSERKWSGVRGRWTRRRGQARRSKSWLGTRSGPWPRRESSQGWCGGRGWRGSRSSSRAGPARSGRSRHQPHRRRCRQNWTSLHSACLHDTNIVTNI